MTRPANATLVIGFDGSRDAVCAIELAGATLRARLAVVVHVWDPIIPAEAGMPSAATPEPAVMDVGTLERRARDVARDGALLAHTAGLAAEPEARQGGGAGGIAQALIDCAQERDADLVVVGRRGMSRLKAVLLGSVSDAVVRDGRYPVLVAPVIDGPDS